MSEIIDPMGIPNKRAALYIRVSTEEQINGHSPEFQEQEMLAWASHKRYRVLSEHIYRDLGYSGVTKIEERPDCTRMFEAAEHHEFEVILVWRIDRLFRKNSYLLT